MVRKPPFFCAVTETARDITEKNTHTQLPPHPLEARILPPLPEDLLHQHIPLGSLTKDVVTLLEVYVDNFIGMTNHPRRSYRLQLSRAMLHGIHSLFPPPKFTGHCGGDSISKKKLDKEDGLWAFKKEVLGWIFDEEAFTMQLPPEKCDSIYQTIKKLLKKKATPLNTYQNIAGRLQHASLAIPGGGESLHANRYGDAR